MEDNELEKVIAFIEGNYNRTLTGKEIVALKEELKEYDYEKFINSLKFPLLKKVEHFTVRGLHQIIEDDKGLQHLRDSLGIKSFEELYEN